MNNTVAEHRKAAGHTQEDLARSVGVSRQTIISIEKGRYAPSLALAFALARHFGVTIEDLFTPS